MKIHPLKNIVKLQKENVPVGIYSACSANPYVIEACLRKGKETNSIVLIEATANQVDQYGGYTGMKPIDFYNFVLDLGKKVGIKEDMIILGGDHLGPLTFSKYDEEKAMSEASELVRQYVLAGFSKIHIDTSMKLNSDDPNVRLSDEIIAKRGATLARVCEDAFKEYVITHKDAIHPVYIVGSEVPIPGGATDKDSGLEVTKVIDFKNTVEAFKEAFEKEGLEEAFKEVIGIVVQPGVEEKDDGCVEYDRSKASELMAAIKEYPNLVFEGHSTDYQTKIKLKELVEDGVGILKVGPGLTFALREALFSLAYIEKELYKNTDVELSNFMEVLDKAMIDNPVYYSKHYHGTDNEIALKRKYSFSDRSRYYMPLKEVNKAKDLLLKNLENGIPLNLLSQFMPVQYTKVREKQLENNPKELLIDKIMYTIDEYLYASNQYKLKSE